MFRTVVRTLGGRVGAGSMKATQVSSATQAVHGGALRAATAMGSLQGQGKGLRRFSASEAPEGERPRANPCAALSCVVSSFGRRYKCRRGSLNCPRLNLIFLSDIFSCLPFMGHP